MKEVTLVLILTRKLGESIVIGDEIKITVVGCNRHQTRIGISAPANVIIHREEIARKIQEKAAEAEKTKKKKKFFIF